jgi:protein-arginine kinase activator protein McsA
MTTCQHCKQANATIHLTTMVKCRPSELHLCEPCSRELNLYAPMSLKSRPPAEGPEPPEEAWLSDAERARLMCPDCRHVNQENWNYCSACGSQRRPA